MSIEKVYDKVAKHYNQELSAEVLNQSNQSALDLLSALNPSIQSIIALGVGDGIYLSPYQKLYPEAQLAGVDISSKMLQAAKKNLNCQTFHGDIAKASHLVGSQKFDLAVAHFVCAYVEPLTILAESRKILKPNGYLSIVSKTLQSVPNLLAAYENYVAKQTLPTKHLKKHIESTLSTVFVPNDIQNLVQGFKQNNFEIAEQKELSIELEFDTSDDFYEFFMLGGWFASGLLHRRLSPKVIKGLAKFFINRNLKFPFKDTLNIAVVLGKNTG